jgi:hypothetical protein
LSQSGGDLFQARDEPLRLKSFFISAPVALAVAAQPLEDHPHQLAEAR